MRENDEHRYDDMLELPHHVSAKHPRMSRRDRAAQFSPFKALAGYEDAVREIIENTDIDKSQKNVILSHQFITKTGAETMRSDSESVSVGGLDNIDISVFDDFDYTALGHIHRPQSLSEKVRYCGSPLKYSFSEAKYDKTVTIVDADDFSVQTIPLKPLHDMRMIKGSIENILSKEVINAADSDDYLHITLTERQYNRRNGQSEKCVSECYAA